MVSLPGYFGVQQSEAFAEFAARPAAAPLPPPSDASAAVSWLQSLTPADDATPALGLETLAAARAAPLEAQPLHAAASAETAEPARDRPSFPQADRDFGLALTCVFPLMGQHLPGLTADMVFCLVQGHGASGVVCIHA